MSDIPRAPRGSTPTKSSQPIRTSARNTGTTYPGPLARSAHLALLSLITDRGFPLENPVTWTWRDLCRRMKITYSGRAVGQIKEAKRVGCISIQEPVVGQADINTAAEIDRYIKRFQ